MTKKDFDELHSLIRPSLKIIKHKSEIKGFSKNECKINYQGLNVVLDYLQEKEEFEMVEGLKFFIENQITINNYFTGIDYNASKENFYKNSEVFFFFKKWTINFVSFEKAVSAFLCHWKRDRDYLASLIC